MAAYFWNGLEHALAGVGCACIFHKLSNGTRLREVGFWLGILVASSALFFVPAHIGPRGSLVDWLYQFCHYPLPDWDILLFGGMKWHRFFLTHSLALPMFGLALTLDFSKLRGIAYGVGVGVASHLLWDAISSSMSTPIVFWADSIAIRGGAAKGWLIANGLSLFFMTVACARHKRNGF